MRELQPSREARALRRKLLSDDEVRLMALQLNDAMGEWFHDAMDRYEIDVEANLRFMSVAARVQEARENKHLDLKEAASAVKAPQYRLRDIEQGRLKHVVPDILVNYVNLVGLNTWFGRWKNANVGIVDRLGL